MKISIITLFPQVIKPYLETSILGRAATKGLIEYEIIDLRPFGVGTHQSVDDKPFGGGVGMVLRADVLSKAIKSIPDSDKAKIILTSASGQPFTQAHAKNLTQENHIIFIAGHYEGIDQRFIDSYVHEEYSIGDYVLTGGELPALVMTDSIVRLIPKVLEKAEATQCESFSLSDTQDQNQLLEYPHYTQPRQFEDQEVPEVLVSGNHQQIKEWRKHKALEKTKNIRPDLLKK